MDGPHSLFGSLGPRSTGEATGQGWAGPRGVGAGFRASQELGEASGCLPIIPGAKVSSSGEVTPGRAPWARRWGPTGPRASSTLSHTRS